MTIYVSLLCALVGLLLYALSANGKVAELGRIGFFAGLMAFLLQLTPRVIGLN